MTKPAHLPLLTSLRFFAAAEVLISHACGAQLNLDTTPSVIRDLFHNGYEAVTFFFLLSGFVLTYAHRQDRDLTSGTSLRRYYFGRIARIYPVYLLALLIAAPQYLYDGMRENSFYAPVEFISSLVLVPTLLQTWYPPVAALWVWPAWSLSVEATFYVVLPFVVPRLAARSVWQQLAICLMLLGVIEGLRIWLSSGGGRSFNLSYEFLHYHFWLFAPVFLLGSALANAYVKYPPSTRMAGLMFNGAGAIILGIFCCRSSVPPWTLSNAVLAPLFAMLVLGATKAEGFLPRLLSHPSMVLLGNASYALYLLHLPLLHWWTLQSVLSSPEVFCLIAVIVSIICYRYFEIPLLRWARGLANGQVAVITAVTADDVRP